MRSLGSKSAKAAEFLREGGRGGEASRGGGASLPVLASRGLEASPSSPGCLHLAPPRVRRTPLLLSPRTICKKSGGGGELKLPGKREALGGERGAKPRVRWERTCWEQSVGRIERNREPDVTRHPKSQARGGWELGTREEAEPLG